ncbi:MAG: hypothetical protein ABIQ66_06065 [Novosphingobium sp.]
MGHIHLASQLLAAFPAVLLAAPVTAHGGVDIPEPTDFALFSLGVIGLILGRRAAMKRGVRPPSDVEE